jgi:SAM-dependent methyltransferase
MVEMNSFNVVDFRFAKSTDDFDLKYRAWSRIYEYQYVLDFIRNTQIESPNIHNSSWGYEGVHVIFRDELDLIGKCTHSDIIHSEFRDTFYYDITTENNEFENKFDFVINISTIEHLKTSEDRLTSIKNLFKQVKPGGYLILTFDYPRVNLTEIEFLINKKCTRGGNKELNGSNSKIVDERYKDLNIVYLILKKNE